MKYKILDNLQFYYQKTVIFVKLDEKYVREKEHVFDIETAQPSYLEVEEIVMKEDKLEIVYQLPEGYTPLIDLKNYANFYKLDILNELLGKNSLEQTHTYLSMTNMVVKTTKDVKLIYKADNYDNLPYDKLPALEQWQNFICSFFGKYTLEQYRKNKQKLVSREKNTFLQNVLKCDSLENLKNLVTEELINEQKQFFADDCKQQQVNHRLKQKKRIGKGLVSLVLLFVYLGTVFYLKNSEAKEIQTVEAKANTEITILNKIIDEDSESIASDMEKLNYPKEKQVDIYVKLNDYNKAYALDPMSDKQIIQNLYKQGKFEEISDLELEGSEILATYQKILAYEEESDLEYIVQTENDPLILDAIIDQVLAQKDISMIRTIRLIPIKQKGLNIQKKSQIKMIDCLIEDNNKQLEETYKDESIDEEEKKTRANEILDENNALLSEKIKLKA